MHANSDLQLMPLRPKPYLQLMPPSNDPKRVLWLFAALLTTLMSIAVWGGLLGGCKSKPAPATAPVVVVKRDTTRDRLKRNYDRAVEHAQAKKSTADSTKKPYEKDRSRYDSVRSKLGF